MARIHTLRVYDISGNLLNSVESDDYTNYLIPTGVFSPDGSKLVTIGGALPGNASHNYLYPIFWDVETLSISATGDIAESSFNVSEEYDSDLIELKTNSSATIYALCPEITPEVGFIPRVTLWNASGSLIRDWYVTTSGTSDPINLLNVAISPKGDRIVMYIDPSDWHWDGTSRSACIAIFDASGIVQTSSVVPRMSPFNYNITINSSSHITSMYDCTDISTYSVMPFVVSYDGSMNKRFDVVTSGIISGGTRLYWGEATASVTSTHVIIAGEYWDTE